MKKIVSIFVFCLLSLKAFAHPHIWVYTDLALKTEGNKIIGVNVNWVFDEMYSSAFLMDADLNKDKKLDQSEAEAMQKQVMEKAVKTITPFIMLKLGGKDVYGYKLDNLKIKYDEENEQVSYNFDLKLHTPRSLEGSHKIALVDDAFYVAFEQSYEFKIPKSCSFDLIEDQDITIYDGMINPEVYQLKCK
ncbi:MAG TPA: hypothetical protein DCL21_05180 [Alphaproteobacteria bacterium]|nr:hypothetical protein [Alphaproteobacteria bacterium]